MYFFKEDLPDTAADTEVVEETASIKAQLPELEPAGTVLEWTGLDAGEAVPTQLQEVLPLNGASVQLREPLAEGLQPLPDLNCIP